MWCSDNRYSSSWLKQLSFQYHMTDSNLPRERRDLCCHGTRHKASINPFAYCPQRFAGPEEKSSNNLCPYVWKTASKDPFEFCLAVLCYLFGCS